LSALPKIFSQKVPITKSKTLTVRAFTAYQKPVEKLIQAKLNGQKIPIDQMAYLLSEHVKQQTLDCDYITPIPLHWWRKMWRGFNQAEILAHEVARVLNKPVSPILKRTKNTLFQSTLTAPERKENLENAFICSSSLKNKKILLIDDLYTTGATAHAAARELYKQGAASVELLVVCKVTD
jgi:ComF family protein